MTTTYKNVFEYKSFDFISWFNDTYKPRLDGKIPGFIYTKDEIYKLLSNCKIEITCDDSINFLANGVYSIGGEWKHLNECIVSLSRQERLKYYPISDPTNPKLSDTERYLLEKLKVLETEIAILKKNFD